MAQKNKRQINLLPLLIFLLINLIALDGLIIYNFFRRPNVLGITDNASVCPTACINLIQKSTFASSSVKEFYVPLGSGTNTTSDFSDVIGAQASVDSTTYGKIKKVTFEATLQVPAGSQTSYVRLFNATDKHPVWFSEMRMVTSGPQLLISTPITLDNGNKIYQVQMKSQLGILTNLNQARIHIITY